MTPSKIRNPKSKILLSIENLHVSYGMMEVLKGISLSVEEGEIAALVGANGAGKTTTLMAISGIVPAAQGKIRFRGKEIQNLPTAERVACGVTQVPEGRKVFPRLTVLENLQMGAALRQAPAAVKEDLSWVLEELFPALRTRLKQLAGTLSGGAQQMLVLGRGLLARPQLLLLDEPSLGLAPKMVMQVFEVIRQIHAKGVTLLLVEQNAYQALQVAQSGTVLETVSARAEQVLDGVASRAEGVLGRLDEAESALRASLTDAFQHVQLDGLGRLDEATSRLIALGPRLERQTNGRLDEVVDRVVTAVADVGEALGRVEQVDQRVGETVRRALEDARRAAADTVVPTAAAEADPELARAVTDAMHQLRGRIDALQASVLEQAESMSGTRRERETALAALSDRMTELMERVDRVASRPAAPNPAPMAPPAAGTGTNTVCPDCGFVARTPPGLAAHRRTCTAGD